MPQAKGDGEIPSVKDTFAELFKNKKYTLGVLSLVLYMGAQIGCWTYIYQYAESKGISSSTAANYQLGAFVLFTVGRAIGTYLLKFMSSGKLLSYFSALGGVFTLGAVILEGTVGLYSLVMVSLFLSVMFPTIYGIALEGLKEDQSKIGAAGLVMAIVGGALLPKLQGMIIDLGGVGVNDITVLGLSEMNLSFLLPVLCFTLIAIYGVWIHRKHNIAETV